MENRKAILDLLTAYLNKQVSREEFDQLFTQLAALEDEAFKEIILDALDSESTLSDTDFIQARVDQLYPQLHAKIKKLPEAIADPIDTQKSTRQIWWSMSAAAAILIFLLAGIYFFTDRSRQYKPIAITPEQILPGGNRATLTLANGQTIDLNIEQSGIVIGDGITYADGTDILDDRWADGKESPMSNVSRLLSLSTPKGGQYQITLSDGTRVWLNAASSITYPVAFEGGKREVSLQGEAYFEVAKDKSRPFIVNTTKQRVEVLGTSFNINAYENETATKTTLLTGSVRIQASEGAQANGNSQMLDPNQQSVVNHQDNKITVNHIDPSAAVAWKDGLFNFHGLSIDESMKQIERWYDIHVVYKGKKPEGYLGGKMSRGVKLATFLSFLEKDFHIKSELQPDRTLILFVSKESNN
ncbi:FecR family protein [Parapedobacter koreensis]|uniref:FecR family protein n=1 Tax=Parapedobacter koreensis TaxID=332977 RepID=A0A1H7SRG7_9SPHI|nr:FecR family protein [Parapedobacter koreensis]SEL74127.1 FecR family protein [Parapedobacter koreensis]